MPITLGAISLPDDMEWTDEFAWLPVGQQVEVTLGGSLLVEESQQLAGRPITLEGRMDGNTGFALVSRATVLALRALAAAPLTAPLVLTLADTRSFSVRFRHGDGTAVEARAMKHIVPQYSTDLYAITLRLIEV
jgi:hypothetical protein